MRLLIAFTSVLFLISGCAFLQHKVQKPSAEVAGVELRSVDFNQATLVMLLDVKNPNTMAVSMSEYEYSLALMSAPFLKGKSSQPIRLLAGTTSRVEVPITIEFAEMMKSIKSARNANEVPYDLRASLLLDIPVFGTTPLNVEYQGKLPVAQLPKIAVETIGLENMSSSSIDLAMSFRVDNPNVFDIQMDQFSYDLKVDGQRWARFNQTQPMIVKAGHSKVVAMPMQLNFKTMGSSLYRKMLDKNVEFNYQLDGESSMRAVHSELGSVKIPLGFDGTMSMMK